MKGLALTTIGVFALSLSLVGCNGKVTKQDLGTAVGAIAGGVIGSQFGKGTGKTVATVGGAVAGGYIGKELTKDKK